MSIKRFSKQSGDELVSHLKNFLLMGDADSFDIKIDTFAKVAEVKKARPGGKGSSKKKEHIRSLMPNMQPKKRKQVLSKKRQEKPKLKTVRNGRMINLKGYEGY